MDYKKNYFKYLTSRSLLGFFYRKYWLYPKLNSKLIGKTLDVGCGIGDFLGFRMSTVGVDIDPKAVKFCKSKGFLVKLMNVNQIPFRDAHFNSIVLDNVLEHIADPKPLLLDISRVLDCKGILLVGVPGEKGYSADSDHKVFYNEDFLKSTLANAGFDCIETFDMPFGFKIMSKFIKSYCIYGVFIKNHLFETA